MPTSFTGYKGAAYSAKLGVVSDGETFSVSGTDGYTITSTLSPYTVFVGNPSRSGVGVYSLTLKELAIQSFLDYSVSTVLTSGTYLGAQKNLSTTDSQGRTVLNFTFNNAGTPANFSTGNGTQQFIVYVVYSETKV